MGAGQQPWQPTMREISDAEIDAAIEQFRAEGYSRLAAVATEESLQGLRERAEAILSGKVQYPGLFFQPDAPSGRYNDLQFGQGWTGPDTNYRKVEKLELDARFRAWLENAVFERIVRRVVVGPVVIYRAVIFSKAARVGSDLPWHQDGGRFWGLDRDAELQLWTGLDDAPPAAGGIEVLPRSHHSGLATPLGGVVPRVNAEAADAEARALPVPTRAGDVLLLHNYLWHRSGPNIPDAPRRGFTVCYMPASTRCLRKKRAPREFVGVFGGANGTR